MARARPISAAWLAWREAVAGDVSAWQCALGGMMARRRRSAGKLRAKRVARSRTAHARAVEATLADIAHEIRTPLTGILALGELLATSELGARERDWAIAIKSTAEHLALVTSLIVDAARSEAKGLVLRRELIRPRRLADALAASLAARAKAMGGDLTVKSEPGRGSRFRMRIAMDTVAEAAETATSEGAAARQAPVRALAVLCVEDNPHGRVLLNTILAELGHRADFVATGAGAVEAVARGSYDVVIMDVTLPDIDGVEATRRIRALPGRAGRVPIVRVSGRVNAEAAGRAAGVNGYLTKPLSPSALTQALGSAAQV